MPRSAVKHGDLHGNVPDESRVALLIIDMINENDRYAMAHMAEVTKADVRPSAEIRC